jgi:hypothetical protein
MLGCRFVVPLLSGPFVFKRKRSRLKAELRTRKTEKQGFRSGTKYLNHTGIIICTYDPDFSGQARRVHDAICFEGKLSGKLIRVNRPQNKT